MSNHIVDVNMTARRVCILHDIGAVADAAHDLDEITRANLLNSLALFVGREGATRNELVTLAAYCLTAVESIDETAAR